MNIHFMHADAQPDHKRAPPRRLYALLDHVVLPVSGGTTFLLAFDAVDADWIAQRGPTTPLFNLRDPVGIERASRRYWDPNRPKLPSPFGEMPLYRIEIEYSFGQGPAGIRLQQQNLEEPALADFEATWFVFDVSPVHRDGFDQALLYHGMFLPPTQAWVRGTLPAPQVGIALKSIFSLANVPQMSLTTLQNLVSNVSSELLGVYDVGQGSASALLDANGRATMYFDLGSGTYRNHSTAPTQLQFCWCINPDPFILLSHWDADHWAGAYWGAAASGPFPALAKTWVAPLQTIGPVHIAFAYDVFTQGNLYIYPGGSVSTISCTDNNGRSPKMLLGSGKTRNHSGIVLCVEDTGTPVTSWLLTGDCDYPYFLQAMTPADPLALVAPHHGASLAVSSIPPQPQPQPGQYRRVVYSFGECNINGGGTGVQHPTIACVTSHINAGWDHGTWPTNPPPGTTIANQDTLATAQHSPPHTRNSIVVGWAQPTTPIWNCNGALCSTSLSKA